MHHTYTAHLNYIKCQLFLQDAGVAPLAACSFEADYNTMKMLQLRSVVFSDLKGSENEVCLIKYLLACSPFLKNMDIHLLSTINSEEKLLFAKKLLKLDRASPVAKIILLQFNYRVELVFNLFLLWLNLWHCCFLCMLTRRK